MWRTSSTDSILLSLILEMWIRPSLPGASSQKAPTLGRILTTSEMNISPTSGSFAIDIMIAFALSAFAALPTVAIFTLPSSSISILTPVSSIILLITLPCLPTTSPIFSGLMLKEIIFGAYSESSALGLSITSSILFKICCLPTFACAIA